MINTKCSKSTAKLVLFFFWSIISTYTIPSNTVTNNRVRCSCAAGACACGEESSCHHNKGKSGKPRKDSLLVSANCQSPINAISSKINLEAFPPTVIRVIRNIDCLSKTFLKKESKPTTVFLEPPFKPPKLSLVFPFV